MRTDGRKILAETVKRHRTQRGWSRPAMSRRVIELGGSISPGTIKNLEAPDKGAPDHKTAAEVERVFGWPSGAVFRLLAGLMTEEDFRMEPGADDDLYRSFQTFRTWPEDVQDAAMSFGAVLATKLDASKRRAIRDRVFRVLGGG